MSVILTTLETNHTPPHIRGNSWAASRSGGENHCLFRGHDAQGAGKRGFPHRHQTVVNGEKKAKLLPKSAARDYAPWNRQPWRRRSKGASERATSTACTRVPVPILALDTRFPGKTGEIRRAHARTSKIGRGILLVGCSTYGRHVRRTGGKRFKRVRE
jgi:hypothetical protein